MKVKYLSFLFLLFLCEFASGQVPGMPKILGKSNFPQAFTISADLNDFSSALVKAQVLDNGQTSVTECGLVWGTSLPVTINTNSGIFTKTGSGAFTSTITLNTLSPTPSSLVTYYIVAYATNTAGTTYGNVITYEHGAVTSPSTGRKWLAYNLGASNIPTTVNDRSGMGDLYQWGRASDGHQIARPTTTVTYNRLSDGNAVILEVPANESRDDQYSSSSTVTLDRQPYFIVSRNGNDVNTSPQRTTLSGAAAQTYGDWLIKYNNNLWQGVNGVNNPCPAGYRLPTVSDFQSEPQISNITNAFASFLKLPYTGFRDNNTNFNITPVKYITTQGNYWTSNTFAHQTVNNTTDYNQSYSWSLTLSISTSSPDFRAIGNAVRCIKDY